MRGGFATAFILTTQAAFAGPPELHWPLDCTQGQSCYIEDYVDAKPGSGQSDYTCGIKSRDGHRGTDIVLRDFEMMQAGTDVLASAPGTVAATRDGMQDVAVTDATRSAIAGKECGNAVRIDHGDGWQTLYCHMKNGSIAVQNGDVVGSGDRLGLIGLSGLTNIPHLHISVLKDGVLVDPFQPSRSPEATCGPTEDMLWAKPPAYHKTGLFTAGMATQVPEFAAVKSGAARETSAHTDQPLVVYGHVFYPRKGDVLELSASGPDGEVFSKTILLKDPQSQLFRAFGRKAPNEGWPTGDYRGMVRLTRQGELIAWRHADITVTSR